MIENIIRLARLLVSLFPFILLALLNTKANLKRDIRSRQFPMPILTLLYSVVLMVLLSLINHKLTELIFWLPQFLGELAETLRDALGGALAFLSGILETLKDWLEAFIRKVNPVYLLLFVSNTLFLLVHIILKRILITFFKGAFKNGGSAHDFFAGRFYEQDEDTGAWHIRDHFSQARNLLKTAYYAVLILAAVAVLVSCEMYRNQMLAVPFYPVFGLLIVGEVYFFLDGLNRREMEQSSLTGEADDADGVANYALMRKVLERLFGDKLAADNTTMDGAVSNARSHDELLHQLEQSDDVMLEAYGRFMRRRLEKGMELDHNYLESGRDLLQGRSILFNNPFYYDLIPYVSYPMNRALLRQKKVLIVLGRHDIEGDVEAWCRDGLTAVTGVPTLWSVGVLSDLEQELDVGIITRSDVHNLAMHEANDAFFRQVEFVVIIEPSRLVTTAQIGLNALVRRCSRGGGKLTFCSTDKNCDGLVDALSHILLTSLTEVSATNHHQGISSYMCWESDGEHLQHRLLPNLSRYLGMGTELSFAALKNQISETRWYGGETFPVLDTHWITRQYYYDLLRYANLPASQEAVEDYFKVSPNLWNAQIRPNQYLTVEDEAFNMFELKRAFSTRAKKQGFINIISPDYLLRDYMADNDGLFNSDPKAIPYIVADYAPTVRNVVMRLCLRMSTGMVAEAEVRRELMLIDIPADDVQTTLWHQICACCAGLGSVSLDKDNRELLCVERDGVLTVFKPETLRMKRRFNMDTGRMDSMYFISDPRFIELLLGDLRSAGYIAEDEKGERQYLGTELRGHIFQKYLPGQFFTFGGKYYEMLRVTGTGHVLVRRAADHITGRPAYRQIREYTLSNVADSTTMGDCVDIAGMRLTKQTADIRVATPAYWKLKRYGDFESGQKVTINGVPERAYFGKQVLRVDLPQQGLTDEICNTVTVLLNEVFRTLFAENHAYIAAINPGEAKLPATYSLQGCEQSTGCIYIIEDSQLDLGLLVAVQRSWNRILAILCDYLAWHMDALDKSLNPPPEPEVPDYTVEPDPTEPKTRVGRFWKKLKEKVGGFFKKLFKRKKKKDDGEEQAEGEAKPGFFGRLFKGKKKRDGAEEPEAGLEGEQPAEQTADGEEAAEGEAKPGFFGRLFKRKKKKAAEEQPEAEGETDGFVPDPLSAEEAEGVIEPDYDGEESAEEASAEEEPAEEPVEESVEEPVEESAEEPAEEAAEEPAEDETMMSFMLMSTGGSSVTAQPEAAETEQAEQPGEEQPEHDAEQDELSFEPVQASAPAKSPVERKPYHLRYYLLYGGTEVPEGIDVPGTRAFLEGLGYGRSELRQAREGVDMAELIEKSREDGPSGTQQCDFCGVELVGTEYEVLSDGRDRCMMCSRTAVRTEEEFREIYRTVIRNLEAFYGARITAPVRVEMVNAKKLHKRLGKSFVPTGSFDGRVLGVAIKDRKGNYTILVENGAPRMQSTLTIAHELIHIWQYLNWDKQAILKTYGKAQELEVYEGMAKWGEIQYAYLIGEAGVAKREEIMTCLRQDEYGRGFCKYLSRYPLSTDIQRKGDTPFTDPALPL